MARPVNSEFSIPAVSFVSNISTIYEIEEHEGQPFIAMELLEGETLRDRIARKRLKVDEMLELGIQIADALDVAHRAANRTLIATCQPCALGDRFR